MNNEYRCEIFAPSQEFGRRQLSWAATTTASVAVIAVVAVMVVAELDVGGGCSSGDVGIDITRRKRARGKKELKMQNPILFRERGSNPRPYEIHYSFHPYSLHFYAPLVIEKVGTSRRRFFLPPFF